MTVPHPKHVLTGQLARVQRGAIASQLARFMKMLAAGLLAAAGSLAFAQTNVTIYGRIDASANYLSFGKTPTKPASHLETLSSDASLLGFTGTEDLGGGQKAFFKLESGFLLDTGTQANASQFYNRESYVGIADKVFGAVRLGSQYGGGVPMSAKVDPFGRFGDGSFIYLFAGPRGFVTAYNNAIEYVAPDVGGFSAKVGAAAGEGAATGRSYLGNIEYVNGPLYVGVLFDQIKATAASVGLVGNAVWSKTGVLAATYDMDVLKLHTWLQQNRISGIQNVNGYMLGLTVPFGASAVRASYTHRSANNASAFLAGLGYDYAFSKRTLVYAVAARLSNAGTAAFQTGPSSVEQRSLGLPGAGQDIGGYQLGIRHIF